MRNTLCRKLAIGVAGAILMALPVIAVAPVSAVDPEAGVVQDTSTFDTAAALQGDTVIEPDTTMVDVGAPALTPTFVPVANVPYVISTSVSQLPGGTQEDSSDNHLPDHDAEASQG